MKIRLEDLKKSLEWIENNTNNIIADVAIDFNKHFKIYCEDKSKKSIEIIIYSVDRNQQSLLKPTLKKTEQL